MPNIDLKNKNRYYRNCFFCNKKKHVFKILDIIIQHETLCIGNKNIIFAAKKYIYFYT